MNTPSIPCKCSRVVRVHGPIAIDVPRETFWEVQIHRASYPLAAGGYRIPGPSSQVVCHHCLGTWRTRARYADRIWTRDRQTQPAKKAA